VFVTPLLLLLLSKPLQRLNYNIKEKYRISNSQKIDFIFPENFIGDALIISKNICGQKEEIKNNYYKLYIPEDGILFYQGEIKNYGGNYLFRYFKIIKNDTIQIPDKFINGWRNNKTSEYKVIYVDAISNTQNNLSKILLHIYKTENDNGGNYDKELLQKDFKCK